MADFIFVGDATPVAQVDDGEITGMDGTPANTTYTVTINGKAISQVGDTDESTTAAALVVLLEASTIPEFAEVTWTNPSVGEIKATADTEGKPFTAALTVAGGSGTVDDFSNTTANDGPEVWSIANFKDSAGDRTAGVLPGVDQPDVVIIEDHSGDILYNLDQSGVANPWTSLLIRASFTGKIGLPQSNTDGTAYDEYRPRYLAADIGVLDIGDRTGNGSGKVRLQLEGTVSSMVVRKTSSSDDDFGAIEIDGNGQTITLASILAGSVDFARDDETAGADIATLIVDTTAVVFVDANCTVAAISVQGGALMNNVALTTLTIEQGSVTHRAGNIGTANVLGGSLIFENPAAVTVTTVAMGTGGVINTDQASAAITFTNISLAPGQLIEDPDRRIALSNPATNPANAAIDELGLNIGRGFTLLWA